MPQAAITDRNTPYEEDESPREPGLTPQIAFGMIKGYWPDLASLLTHRRANDQNGEGFQYAFCLCATGDLKPASLKNRPSLTEIFRFMESLSHGMPQHYLHTTPYVPSPIELANELGKPILG
jgi:hypothetical protein